jgi:hypothetical protein
MDSKELALLRGFDLFFADASAKTLENIARQLGGRYSFNAAEGRATYMFEKIICVKIASLAGIHKVVNECGKTHAAMYGCHYEYSELYVTVSKKSKFAAI